MGKLKRLRNVPFEIFNKPTEVTHELLKQDEKTFHTYRNHLIPFFPEEPLLFPHIQIYEEQQLERIQDPDTSGMIQNNSNTSCDNSESDDNVFEHYPFCNDIDDQSFMLDTSYLYSNSQVDN